VAAIFTGLTWHRRNRAPAAVSRSNKSRIQLFNGRHLSKQGSRKRQLEYAQRTGRKTIEKMQ